MRTGLKPVPVSGGENNSVSYWNRRN